MLARFFGPHESGVLNMSESNEEEEVTHILLPTADLAWIVDLGDEALSELRELRAQGIRIKSDRLYDVLKKLGDKRLHTLVFDMEDEEEEEESCCLRCGKCGGCECEANAERDAQVAYI